MQQKPLISVIVPIYNVEKYLNKCINSIINQTLQNIEIILVNDGSTDNCGKIIDEYAKIDNRVVVIHKENGGQSSAKNMGINIARGSFIGFVDSDDWIEHDMYELLYSAILESNADICVCGRNVFIENGKLTNEMPTIDEEINFDIIKIEDYIINTLFYKHTVICCNKIYKTEIIHKHNIRFDDVDYVGSEDALFNYKLLCHIKKIRGISKIGYSQLARMGSTTKSYKYGYVKRTGNLIKCMDNYSSKTGNFNLAKEILPIILLFYHQWNISQIKTYSDESINSIIARELSDGTKISAFKYYTKKLAFSKGVSKHMKQMGFKLQGRLLIRLVMSLITFKQYKLATNMILIK